MMAGDEKTRRLNKKTCVAHAQRLIRCVPWITPMRCCQLGKRAAPGYTQTVGEKMVPSIHKLGIQSLHASTRYNVGVRSTPVASTHSFLTKPPSFVLAFITLTAATAPITLSVSTHIWVPVLKHTLLKKQNLVLYVRLSGSFPLCSLQTHQVCTTDAIIGTDATDIENGTWQCQVAAIKSSSPAHRVGSPVDNGRKCGESQTGRSHVYAIMHSFTSSSVCMCICVHVP